MACASCATSPAARASDRPRSKYARALGSLSVWAKCPAPMSAFDIFGLVFHGSALASDSTEPVQALRFVVGQIPEIPEAGRKLQEASAVVV